MKICFNWVFVYQEQQWSTPHIWIPRWAEMGCPRQPYWQRVPGTGTAGSPSSLSPGDDTQMWVRNLKLNIYCKTFPRWSSYNKTKVSCDKSCSSWRNTHSIRSLADGLDVRLVPFSRHSTDDLTVINEVAGDVSATNESGLFPCQHHGVPHTFQHTDAIGRSRGCWDSTRWQLTVEQIYSLTQSFSALF